MVEVAAQAPKLARTGAPPARATYLHHAMPDARRLLPLAYVALRVLAAAHIPAVGKGPDISNHGPAVEDVFPRGGPFAGGTTVTISGRALGKAPIGVGASCRFGFDSVPALVLDARRLACVSPLAPPTATLSGGPQMNVLSQAQRGAPPEMRSRLREAAIVARDAGRLAQSAYAYLDEHPLLPW